MAKSQQKSSSASEVEPIVKKAFDRSFSNEELAEAVGHLSPDAAALLVVRLELALRKRKVQLTGYLLALVVWLIGMVFALAYFGMSEGFTGWVFLVPFGAVGGILYAFGKWAERIGAASKATDAPRPTL